jgi:signal transduction histidine kinase
MEEVTGIHFLYDAQGGLTTTDLLLPGREAQWQPMTDGRPSIFGDGAHWLRFELTNALASQEGFVLVFDRWEQIEGYILEGDTLRLIGVTGQTVPFAQRPSCGTKGNRLCLTLEAGATRQLYVRLQQHDRLALLAYFMNIRVGTELTSENEVIHLDNLVMVTMALLMFMLVYNVLMYISTRQYRYRFYLIHMVVVELELCRRSGFLNFLWWDLDYGPMCDNVLFWILNLSATFLLWPLILDYLDVDKYLPRWGRRLRLLVIPPMLLGVVSFFSQHLYMQLAVVAMIFFAIVFSYVNVLLLRVRHPTAVYFLPAMILFSLGTILNAMSEAGLYYLGDTGEVIARYQSFLVCDVILSYGLGRLIYLLGKENESKRMELIAALTAQRETQIRLGRKILDIQERVREDIASQLHDDVQNLLVSSRFNLMAARPVGTEEQGPLLQDLEFSIDQLKTAIQVVRRISHDLHPASLAHPDGLGVSIENFLHWEDRDKHIGFHYQGAHSLPFPIRTLAYRIVQALVAEFHAIGKGTDADLSIQQNEQELKIIGDFPGCVMTLDDNASDDRTKGAMQVLELFSGSVSVTADGKGGSIVHIGIPT